MIGRLRGMLISRAADHVMMDVNGVGYIVQCSEAMISRLPRAGASLVLYTEMIVREDLMQLIGFESLIEREWFRHLTSVQGVGAKAALSLLSALKAEDLSKAIMLGDWALLKSAKGVGPKMAQRITYELSDKVPDILAKLPVENAVESISNSPNETEISALEEDVALIQEASPPPSSEDVPSQHDRAMRGEVLSALNNLGYSQTEALKALMQAENEMGAAAGMADLLRASLRNLAPKG